jgi:hypothetical protein
MQAPLSIKECRCEKLQAVVPTSRRPARYPIKLLEEKAAETAEVRRRETDGTRQDMAVSGQRTKRFISTPGMDDPDPLELLAEKRDLVFEERLPVS